MTKPGILALWKDCAPGREAELEHWFASEHLAERVGVPGFRRGRRFEAAAARRRYFTCYNTDAPEVLVSPAYRERLDNPTPLTTQIMSGVMINMSRTICRVERRIGAFRGAHAVTAHLTGAEAPEGALEALAAGPGIARVELWAAAVELAIPVSEEERMRGGDERIAACLLIETLREADAVAAAGAVDATLGDLVSEIGRYRLVSDLTKEDLEA
jgi:hypothetical protein